MRRCWQVLASVTGSHRVQINPSSIVTLVVISQFERQPVEAGATVQPARCQWAAVGATQASRTYHRHSLVHHRHGSRQPPPVADSSSVFATAPNEQYAGGQPGLARVAAVAQHCTSSSSTAIHRAQSAPKPTRRLRLWQTGAERLHKFQRLMTQE